MAFRGKNLTEHLQDFERLCQQSPGPVRSSWQRKNGPGKKLVVGFMVHGDEVGSLPAINDWLESMAGGNLPYAGELTVFLGNPKAAKLVKRSFESDLNRVFNEDAKESFEKRRAQELKTLLGDGDLFIDLHQTIAPSEAPFYIFSFHEPSVLWARALGASDILVTHRGSYSEGNMGTDEFAMAAGVPSMTFEAFEKGFSEASFAACRKILERAGQLFSELPDLKDLEALRLKAEAQPALRLYHRVHAEAFSDLRMRLREGLKNFTPITKGELLGQRGDGTPFFAPVSGFMLFPKYPERDKNGQISEPHPDELYMLVREAEWEDFK